MHPPGLGGKPPHVTTEAHFAPWFDDVMNRLLNHCDFVVNSERYRFAELEAYYFGPGHPDPFTHRDPIQYETGRWYFHKTAGVFRGGTFASKIVAAASGRPSISRAVTGVRLTQAANVLLLAGAAHASTR